MTKPITPPPLSPGLALPDPDSLTVAERQGLRIVANNPRLMRTKNGYRQISASITLKLVERLERLHLVRQVVAGAGRTVVLTGAGLQTLGVIDERRARRAGEGRASV